MTLTIDRPQRTPVQPARTIKSVVKLQPATCLHPMAIVIPLIPATYLVIAFWVTFAGGEASLDLALVTLILVMLFGLIAGCGAAVRNVEPDRATTRTFREFLDGDVDIETGRITGREALWQIAAMPTILAIGGTAILACAVSAHSSASFTSVDQPAAVAAVAPLKSAPATVSSGGITLKSDSVNFPDSDRTFPGGADADAINNNCLACHSAGMVLTQPRQSRAAWHSEVDKMRDTYKAPIAEEDVPAIVDYLAKLSNGK
jgi:hypothetical protein